MALCNSYALINLINFSTFGLEKYGEQADMNDSLYV